MVEFKCILTVVNCCNLALVIYLVSTDGESDSFFYLLIWSDINNFSDVCCCFSFWYGTRSDEFYCVGAFFSVVSSLHQSSQFCYHWRVPNVSCDWVCDAVPVLPFFSCGGVDDCIELQGICSDFSCLIIYYGIKEVCWKVTRLLTWRLWFVIQHHI